MMNGIRHPRTTLVCVLIALAGLGALGCSKKITRVDPGYTNPEGRFSQDARLILYPDVAVNLFEFIDKAPIGPDPDDSLVSTFPLRLHAAGVIHGLVVDGTDANTYQVLRRESGGGYLPLKDYVLHPAVRWLETHWEVYQFEDPVPAAFSPPTYLGRGLVQGVLSPTSPLTNLAQAGSAGLASIRYSGARAPLDSLFRTSWGPVAGAAGYWVQVFQYVGAPTEQVIANGLPSPFATGNLVDLNVTYVPAPDTVYKIGTTPTQLFAQKQILTSGAYFVRIAAVDANGCMIGFSYGDLGVAFGATTYVVYSLGAFVLEPKRPSPGPLGITTAFTTGQLSPTSPLRTGTARIR